MKVLKLAVFAGLCSVAAFGQLFGALTDTPQHVFGVGVGVGPTSRDLAGEAGWAEKITGVGTYSFSGVSFVPQLVPQANGKSAVSVTATAHTGIKQILYQGNRVTVAVDAGAGISMPSQGAPSINFSADGSAAFFFRLNKVLNTCGGCTNNYLFVGPRWTETPNGPILSVGLGWAHGIN